MSAVHMTHIRTARADDLEALQAIEARGFATDRLSRRSFAKAIIADHHILLVAADEADRAVGYALIHLRRAGGRLRLYSIAVDPAHRGSGIGRDLLAACEAEAARRGLECIRLEVRRDEPRLQAFYQRQGYAARKVLAGYYEDGGSAVQMEKVLPAAADAASLGRRPSSFVIVVGRSQDRKPLEEAARALNVGVISAADYLARPDIAAKARQVINLCPVEDYLSQGYYVSLLAEARAQRAIPNIDTVSELAWKKLYKNYLGELTALVNGRVPPEVDASPDGKFAFEVYFGQAGPEWVRRMAARAYRLFPAPILEVMMSRHRTGWQVDYIWPLSIVTVSAADLPRFLAALGDYCHNRRNPALRRRRASFDLAILVNPKEAFPPSTETAIRNFVRAADRQHIQAEVIGPKDIDRLSSFDALFIRETTNIDNHTYTFARMAEAGGMPVIDDPMSILRCSNKVYLREAMARARIATPKTVMVTKARLREVADTLAYPTVLKIPDGSFSRGVVKVSDAAEFRQRAAEMLEDSFIILAQEYLPTAFDWRIGVLDGRPLFACKYMMARGHWQIYHHTKKGKTEAGGFETLLIEDVPPAIVKTAVRASLQMGRGLYGVDLKEIDATPVVIEVNDNPNIDAGIEDKRAGEALYDAVISLFRERILVTKGLAPRPAAPA
ncbi:MAG: hypothetical protein BroJett030_10180 [Alphaproteobacteria bacterium]|nr:MAG: hypothetical protein BroJett030_10180 [Alphaproteobacteria bacterium]